MWNQYYIAANLNDALTILDDNKGQAKLISGGTDLMLEMERGGHKEKNILIDISRISGLNHIHLENGTIHIGALVTHNQVASSDLIQTYAMCLAEACYQVGSPQIRNRGTIAGNLLTASPANDTITPLAALDAHLVLVSLKGERRIEISKFYTGVRKTIIQDDEILKEIVFKVNNSSHSSFYKFALRNAQAISVVNAAVYLNTDGNFVKSGNVAMGAVAPTIVRMETIEKVIPGKTINDLASFDYSSLLNEIAPISDIRSSAEYRLDMANLLIRKCFEKILDGINGHSAIPSIPVTLDGRNGKTHQSAISETVLIDQDHPIETTINGKSYEFSNIHSKSLLHLVREDAGLIGSKEGCDEGECGACTMYLDGKAVMSCLVPAPHAHLAQIQTIEGISPEEELHPVQKAFIDEGAVQCGYCTPGFIMSAVKLLEEKPKPIESEIKEAITGNLCRCTGYYKIVKAIEKASYEDERQ